MPIASAMAASPVDPHGGIGASPDQLMMDPTQPSPNTQCSMMGNHSFEHKPEAIARLSDVGIIEQLRSLGSRPPALVLGN